LLIGNEQHLRRMLTEYLRHYTTLPGRIAPLAGSSASTTPLPNCPQDTPNRISEPHRSTGMIHTGLNSASRSGMAICKRDRDRRADGDLPARLPFGAALPRGNGHAQVYPLRWVHAGLRHHVLDPVEPFV
jgi:hypothetical protein